MKIEIKETEIVQTFISCMSTPQQYNKKPVEIDQGLDFLKFGGGKWRKTIEKT